jgi:hypothetical protein
VWCEPDACEATARREGLNRAHLVSPLKHWASDVMVGWGDGVRSGYVLPSLLHFGFGGERPVGEIRSGTIDMAPTLLPRPGGTELGMVGVF